METYRLKNIAILILLLLNGFLLALLGYQYLQSHRAAEQTLRQLRGLMEGNELSLLCSDAQLLEPPLSPLALQRSGETEEAIAAYLLGGQPEAARQGGGSIVSYSTGSGSIQFRAGGGFGGSGLSTPVSDIDDFSRQFCQAFGYGDMVSQLSGQGGSVTATQYVAGVPVVGCEVTLSFENGALTGVTGSHAGMEDAAGDGAAPAEGDQLSCVTALVRFLDYRNASSIVCREVRSVQCVYVLQSASSALRLLPVWQVETDTYVYFVDCSSGEVSRR